MKVSFGRHTCQSITARHHLTGRFSVAVMMSINHDFRLEADYCRFDSELSASLIKQRHNALQYTVDVSTQYTVHTVKSSGVDTVSLTAFPNKATENITL